MCKDIKSISSVISADSAAAHAAKRQMVIGEMPYGIIDTSSAKRILFHPRPYSRSISCKKIKSQRVRMLPDDVQRFVHRTIRIDRQDRTEYLFLHQRALRQYLFHQRGFDIPCASVIPAPIKDLPL